jgi:hypothetical protein
MIDAVINAFGDPALADARQSLRLSGFKLVPLSEYRRFMA